MGCVAFVVAAFLGNVAGYEIGRAIGPPVRRHDGRIIKKKYLDQTVEFFDKHGSQALVIGRFVPFVRTYVTLVAGVSEMNRRRSSGCGASSAPCSGSSASCASATSSARRSRGSATSIDLVILGPARC